ncbi:MAG: carboxylesterase family protein [Nitrospirae bacterium]|nr:carboxylesterase family protein [Nitrospirota bacterium]
MKVKGFYYVSTGVKKAAVTIAVILAIMSMPLSQAIAASCSTGNVTTTQGTVCGISNASGTSAYAYLGIPFGESTAGNNRWAAPIAKQPWSSTFQATSYGPMCPQSDNISNLTNSEDCLSINVWTPVNPGKSGSLPVMVFIYGGAFIFGTSSSPTYDGAYLASQQNVVLVTFNYRVGAFGFLKYGSTVNSNFGILDQQLALKWVQNNIGQFGGDPAKVTIFGESAGAMSVGIHLTAAPNSASLFRAGIMESNPFGMPYKSPDQAQGISNNLAIALGCLHTDAAKNLECMRAQPMANVYKNSINPAVVGPPMALHGIVDSLPWAPIIDGTVITQEPILAIKQGKLTKPVILGTNKNEGTLFALGIQAIADKVSKDGLTCQEYNTLLEIWFGAYALVINKIPAYACNSTNVVDQLSNLMTDYIFHCANMYVAKQASATNSNVYAYGFEVIPSFFALDKLAPACANQSCHTAELPFVFNSAAQTGHTFTAAEQVVANEMGTYWANLAKNLTPASSTYPSWPAFSSNKSVFLFNTNSQSTIQNPIIPICDFWDVIGYNHGGVTSN